jgi:hypothetical protein
MIIFIIIYGASVIIHYFNSRSLIGIQNKITYAFRYLLNTLTTFILLSPIFFISIILIGPYGDPHMGLPQVCISAGESVGCKMYNDRGITNEVVQWCENVHMASEARYLNGEFKYLNWEPEESNWEDISKSAYATNSSGDMVLKISASRSDNGLEKIDSITKGTADAIYPCINPSKGGYVYIKED